MSNTPKIDELLDRIYAYGVDWTEFKDKQEATVGNWANDHAVSTFAGKIKTEAKELLKAQLFELITKDSKTYKIINSGTLTNPVYRDLEAIPLDSIKRLFNIKETK